MQSTYNKNAAAIKKIRYSEQFYGSTLDTLHNMERFLENDKVSQEEI